MPSNFVIICTRYVKHFESFEYRALHPDLHASSGFWRGGGVTNHIVFSRSRYWNISLPLLYPRSVGRLKLTFPRGYTQGNILIVFEVIYQSEKCLCKILNMFTSIYLHEIALIGSPLCLISVHSCFVDHAQSLWSTPRTVCIWRFLSNYQEVIPVQHKSNWW